MNETVASIIIALAAAIPGILALIANRRKSLAESNNIEMDSLRDTISALRDESNEIRGGLDNLEKKFVVCKEDLDATIAENAILARKITALNQSISDVTQEMFELKRANELLRKAIEDRDRIIAEFRERFERPLGGKA